jgi:AcrR family transcriptional regulator
MMKYSRAEQKALRPHQILEAAFEEFLEQGFKATRVEDIARRVGVTKGTVYVYFATKEDLFTAMVRHISLPAEGIVADFVETEGSCANRLRSLILLLYRRILEDRRTRELIRFIISEGSRIPEIIDDVHDEVIEPIFARTQALIDEGVEKGEFRKGPPVLVSVIIAPVFCRIIENLIFNGRREDDLDAYMETHIDLVLKGLR